MNRKNTAEELNALIRKTDTGIITWTPKPGAVLDLGLALRDPMNRCVGFVCVCVHMQINMTVRVRVFVEMSH